MYRDKKRPAETAAREQIQMEFVRESRVVRNPLGNVRFDWILSLFWSLMILKCLILHVAIVLWELPVNPLAIWLPALLGAAILTAVYWRKF